MGKTMYLECSTGISGDMFVAALLDLGADQKVLETALESLHTEGARIRISRVNKAGLDACDFDVVLDEAHENHDHDMEYLYGSGSGGYAQEGGHDHTHDHDHHHEYGCGHGHKQACVPDHMHEHGCGRSSHEHRDISEVTAILKSGRLTERAERLAEKIFRILAEAEGKAHGVSPEKVHFHEVGALDSILDVAAAAVCMDNLDITQVIIPQINEGQGRVRCQHGLLPVPVPAVANIAEAYRLPLHIMEEQGEFVTPTGAAIAAAIRTGDSLPHRFRVLRSGLGAGKRAYRNPSILRAFLIEEIREPAEDYICRLESNIDDCTGEALGYAMERLLEAGARDVHYTPVFMKKNRPAYQLNVICTPEDAPAMEKIIFEETTTIGIRRAYMERTVLERETKTVRTPYGEIAAKVCGVSGAERWYPEYRDVAAAAKENGVSYQEVYRAVLAAFGREAE